MTVQRCEEISSYTDNDNNTMMKQGCVNTAYTDNETATTHGKRGVGGP